MYRIHIAAVAIDEGMGITRHMGVARIETRLVRGAADHVHVNTVKTRGGKCLFEFAYHLLEFRGFAAVMRLSLFRERIVNVRKYRPAWLYNRVVTVQ